MLRCTWVAELFVDDMLACARGTRLRGVPVASPTAFPSVKRDLSVLIKNATSYDAVHRTIREVAGETAQRVELIDRFTQGTQVPSGMYSLTFSIEYRDPSRTLTADEVDALHPRIGQTLVRTVGATLR